MSKKLLSENQINRWAKLSGVKLNENYGGVSPMGARDDEMGGDEGAPMDGAADEMPAEMPEVDMDSGTEKTLEDDELMSMIEKAVENVLVKMGLGDEGEVEGGGDELDSPDTDMEDLGGEEEGGEDEEETLDETLEIVSDDEVINETLKRVIKRLVG